MTNKTKLTNRNHDNDDDDACSDHDYVPVPKLSLSHASIVVVIVSVFCFWNSQHCEFTFDDNSAILENADIRSDTSLWNIFENDFWGTRMKSKLSHKSYRPLTVLTYRLNYLASGGYNSWSFHVVNLVLHTVNCVLLLRVFSVLFSGSGGERKVFESPRRSLLAAVLFAVHPIHTESVSLFLLFLYVLFSIQNLAEEGSLK